MPGDFGSQELLTLKTIAETLNRSNDLDQMLDEAVQQFLAVTGLTTGWIFLVGERPHYTCVADCGLPPALSRDGKSPMRTGTCWCIADFWSGELKHAVDVMTCKRIDDAIKYKWGATDGIERHATVPLMAGGELFGILNVAAPGKDRFSADELALLESVSFQIGTAVERVRLYQAEQCRAERLARLNAVSREFGAVLDLDRLPSAVVQSLNASFGWAPVALFLREGDALSLRAIAAKGRIEAKWRRINPAAAGPVGAAFLEQRAVLVADAEQERAGRPARGLPRYRSAIAVPVTLRQEGLGVLLVGSERPRAFSQADLELLQALSDHVALALENARLYEQRREIARLEERNRLARDLHDSVSQTLFSLTFTARGAEGAMSGGHAEAATAALREIRDQAQSALKEMRSLIWQLRPAGLEDGLVAALRRYGKGQNLQVDAEAEGLRTLSGTVEEALWRIGQEALNNVCKHAGTERVQVRVRQTGEGVSMTVADQGKGMSVTRSRRGRRTLGMSSMRERAEALGGTFEVQSRPGSGTLVRVFIPEARHA